MVRRMNDPFDPDYFVIVADVHIIGIEPRVSRVLELPVKLNFTQFHDVLQTAFGWTDSHLHQFHVGGLTIGAPEFNEDSFYEPRTFEASEIRPGIWHFPTKPTRRSQSSTSMILEIAGVT